MGYGASQWALVVRLIQKKRRKSPWELRLYKTGLLFGPFWLFWAIQATLVILASHFRTKAGLPGELKKARLGSCSNQRDRAKSL